MDGAEGEDNAEASHFEVYSSNSEVAFGFRVSSALLCKGNSLTLQHLRSLTNSKPHICVCDSEEVDQVYCNKVFCHGQTHRL